MGANISHRRKRVSSLQSKKEKECPSIIHKSPTTSNSSDSVILSGRKFHSDPNSVYWLPSDEEEMDRLVGQHFALRTLFEGNIPQVAFKMLDFEKGVKILDLGCGPGTWIMDMATEYPNSEFVGIDMCDVFPTNIRPANVTFQVSNALDGLPFEDNSFDMVNFSLFILALKKDQWLPLMKEIHRILKPGGLFHSREASMLLLGNQFVQWASQVFEQRLIERNQEPAICDKIKDIMQEAGFDILSCVKKHTYPARPDHLNREFLWDIKHIFKGCQPFLQDHLGLTTEQYPTFLQQLVTECQKSPEPRWDIVSTLGRKST
ncbi:S-adenosyl-L-methionine-dependent methyltransferase [Rhizopus microsporus]|uniref:S-adenosyl-L-methionine-dependent methyltransferase n=1 Tax=Rhizopus microsporus TaxID=58291 RepID=A0A1X0RW65_RHIZD|nr:S-adenosyl-L-methionine-dependent methyltransferase [Rhizopus microsporus]